MSIIFTPRNRYEAANHAAKNRPSGHLEPGAIVTPCLGSATPDSRVLRAYFARKRVRKAKSKKGGKPRLELEPLAFAYPGNAVTLVIETAGLRGEELEVRIFTATGGAALAPDTVSCCYGDAEQSVFKGTVGAGAQEQKYANAAAFRDLALIDIELRPEDPGVMKRWSELLHADTDKRALLYLKVKATGAGPVLYLNEDDALPRTSTDEGVYLNRAGAHFRLSACICKRDLRAEELTAIRKRLAESEDIPLPPLFGMENCPLPAADRTAERFLEELNRVFSVYGIDTCVRRLHFLAQIYHESARFGTTLECASGDGYDPGAHREATPHGHVIMGDGRRYKGRGIIQLTWRDQQKKYLRYAIRTSADFAPAVSIDALFDRSARYHETYYYTKTIVDEAGIKHSTRIADTVDVDGASLIASKLCLAMDSAGWYWSNTDDCNVMQCHTNDLADPDSVLEASRCTNGKVPVKSIRGYSHRVRYTEQLRQLFANKYCQTIHSK
jgi:hypothetical protein